MADQFGAIPVLSLKLIQESIARARMSANEERKTEAAKRIDYYKGDQLGHLRDVLHKQFAHPERLKLQLQFCNITRRIIDTVSVVYKKPPMRRLINAEGAAIEGPGADAYAKMMEQAKVDAVLKKANRYANLLNTVGVQVVWRNERVELDILTPDILNIVQDPADPTAATAVIVERAFGDTVAMTGNPYEDKKLFISWTADQHMVFDSQGTAMPELANEEGVNPYGVIPIVWFRDDFPDGMFWNEGTYDLICAQESINVKLTELNQLVKMQSFSVPVIIGDKPEGNLTVDPSNYVNIPLGDPNSSGTPDFKFVSPNPKINEILEVIRDEVTRIATDWGISPEQFRLTGSPTSGFALKMQNLNLIERREDDVAMYSDSEMELFKVMRIVHNLYSKVKIPEDAELSVNFAEMTFPDAPAEKDAQWDRHIKAGLRNRAEWLMSIDPDIKTVEDAKAKIAENRQINKETQGESMLGLQAGGLGGGLESALGATDEEDEEEEGEEPEA